MNHFRGFLRVSLTSLTSGRGGSRLWAMLLSPIALLLFAMPSLGQVVNEPPASPRTIVVYPRRDSVRTGGYISSHDKVTITLLRNGIVVDSVGPMNSPPNDEDDDDDASAMEVKLNRPHGICWPGVTPFLRPGDQIRTDVVQANGTHRIDQTTIQDVVSGRPVRTGPSTVQIHGTARDENGNPFPVAQLQTRLVTRKGSFRLNGKNTLEAGGGGKNGTLSYDPIDPAANPTGIRWTATFSGLSASDVTLALGADSDIVWLGTNPTTRAGRTVFENGPGISHGPAIPPCAAGTRGEAPDTLPPTMPSPFTATASGSSVTLTWGASQDDVGVRYYNLYRDGTVANPLLIKTVGGSTLTYADPNVPDGSHTYMIDAEDASGNHSNLNTATVAVGAPTITSLSPTSGSTAGGDVITVTGTGFSVAPGATAFSFGPVPATAVTCASTTSCTVTSPASAAGTVDVRATVGGQQSPLVPADQFTYVTHAPALTLITPASGVQGTSVLVTLAGASLTGATALNTPAGIIASSVTITDTQITALFTITANAATGPISVTTPGGTSNSVAFAVVASTPTANAGPDQTATSGQTVAFFGSGSDPNGLPIVSLGWAQTVGPFVVLNQDATTGVLAIVAPVLPPGAAPLLLTFELTVENSNGTFSAPDSVNVVVSP